MVTKQPITTQVSTFTHLEYPSLAGVQQMLHYYFVPYRTMNNSFDGVPYDVVTHDGTRITLTSVSNFLSYIEKSTNAVNNVVNMYVSDYIGIDFSVDGNTLIQNLDSKVRFVGMGETQATSTNAFALTLIGSSGFDVKEVTFPNFYNYFTYSNEGKFLNAPYSLLTLDDFKGNRIDINPLFINGSDLTLVFRGSLSPDNKVSVGLKNTNTTLTDDSALRFLSQEIELLNINPQALPIRVDQLSAFMQGNRNSLQNSRNSMWFNAGVQAMTGVTQGLIAKGSGDSAGLASSATGAISGLGNSYFNLQSLNAKVEDIRNLPPSLQSKGTNPYYDYGYNNHGVMLLFKTIRQANKNVLSDFFKQFGYKTNRVIVPNLTSMTSWNYIQTENAGLFGSIPNTDLVKLRSIFDNGVTLWHTNDIGNYNLGNGVR